MMGVRLHAWEPLAYLFRFDQKGTTLRVKRVFARGKFLPVVFFFHFWILWARRLLTEFSLQVLELLCTFINLRLLVALLLLYSLLLALQELAEMGFVFERCWRSRQIQLFWLASHCNVEISLWHGLRSLFTVLGLFRRLKRSCHLKWWEWILPRHVKKVRRAFRRRRGGGFR